MVRSGSTGFSQYAIILIALLMCSIVTNAQDTVLVADQQEEFLENEVKYFANDSIRFNVKDQVVYLYGQALVEYEDVSLKAAYIAYDFDNQIVVAHGTTDSLGLPVGKPLMDQGGNSFEADSIRYNIQSETGVIKNVRTNEGESYVLADRSKRHYTGEIHNKGGRFTTCDRPNPHYHFGVGKMMVIPDDKIIVGPALLKVGNVPLPLGIPFGFFPNQNNGTSGILIPAWGESDALGFYLLNGGFYTPLGDRMDLQLTGDIYSRGSWGARALSRYKTRYRYAGSLDFSSNTRLTGDPEIPGFTRSRSFFLRWNHQVDTKASLRTRFSANVNAGSSNNFSNTINSSTFDFLSNTFQSNVAWTLSFPELGTLGVNFRHSQNTLNRTFDVTLPSLNFNMSRMLVSQIFGRENAINKHFYDDFAITYSTNFDNRLSTTEDQLRFNNLSNLLDDFNNGIRHNVNLTSSYKTKFFSVNPRVTFTDLWYFRTIDKRFDAVNDSVITDTIPGFERAGSWNSSVNLTSKLYGTFQLNGKHIKAIRHVITPSVGVSYQPDQSTEIEGPFGPGGSLSSFSPFDIGIFGRPPSGESGRVNFGIVQNLEAKMRDKSASSEDEIKYKKVRLLEFLGVNSNWDWIRDSLNWSNISVSARTTLLEKFNVNFNSSFDPYATTDSGTRLSISEWKQNRRIARLTNANIAVGVNFKSKRYGETGQSLNDQDDDTVVGEDNPDKGARIDLRLPWRVNLNYSYGVEKLVAAPDDISHSVLVNGDVNVTKQLKLGVTSGYDLISQAYTPTSLNLFYDLHCWEFNVNYIPNGFRQSISFRINVKASILSDLKYEQRRPINNDGNFLF